METRSNTKKADAGAPTKRQEKYNKALTIIQRLREGSCKRYELRELTCLDDRSLRQLIRVLRRSGVPIINLSNGRGYKLAKTQKELDRYKSQEFSRANDLISTLNAMKLGPDLQEDLFQEIMLWAE